MSCESIVIEQQTRTGIDPHIWQGRIHGLGKDSVSVYGLEHESIIAALRTLTPTPGNCKMLHFPPFTGPEGPSPPLPASLLSNCKYLNPPPLREKLY